MDQLLREELNAYANGSPAVVLSGIDVLANAEIGPVAVAGGP